ncbi:MAG: helix-turn-helix transcriptional regulator [Pseudomonadota bacterium]
MSALVNLLANEFADKDYAHGYMEGHLISRIAAQIHALRKQRGWSQLELAEKAGISQERVSKIESADFTSLTLKSLLKFSEAFDVNLHVTYNSFCEGILDVANLEPERLKVASREESIADIATQRVLVPINSDWQPASRSGKKLTLVKSPPLHIVKSEISANDPNAFIRFANQGI